jgi:tRNA pseudouridine55 synthase
VHGIVLIDKAAGWTSNRTTRRVQRLCGAKSAGHLGTLDPFATGLLPVMLGDATRLAPLLEGGTKVYLAEMALGVTTDTLDREGEVTATRDVPPDAPERLRSVLPRFVGTLRQRIPDYSAAKVAGVRRCDLARAGREPDPKFKEVVIHSIRLLDEREADSPPSVSGCPSGTHGAQRMTHSPLRAQRMAHSLLLEVACGPGTYVRQLVADLGEALGCGAHAASLRRIAVGAFREAGAVTVEKLESTPPESRSSFLVDLRPCLPSPPAAVGDGEWQDLSQGKAIPWAASADMPDGTAVLVAVGPVLRAIAVASGGVLRPRRVLASGVALTPRRAGP